MGRAPGAAVRDLPTFVSLCMGPLVALLVLGSPLTATGQPEGTTDTSAFEVVADSMESKEDGSVLLARGNVRIRRDAWTLYADEVDVDQSEETFIARGSVLLFDGGNQIQGSLLEYNYGTGQGVVYDAQGFLLPATTFSAKELYRDDERTYRLVRARYTSCAVCEPPPHSWEFRAAEVTIHPEEFAWGTHGTLWAKGIPVLYVPIYRHPLGERQTGFLSPSYGQNSEEGFIFGEEFFWAISDSQDATLGVIYRSKRGVSPTVEYRYMLEDGMGSLNAEYLDDREEDKDRYVVQFRHQQDFTRALSAKADINVRSDEDFPEEFAVGFRDRTNLVNSSSGYLTYALPRHAVSLAGEFFETRDEDAPDADDSLLRGPELTVTSLSQPLWEGSALLFEQGSNLVYFERKEDISVTRLDLHPGLSLPIPVTSYITLTPRAAFRGTFYSQGAKDIEGDAVNRQMLESGAELSSRLFRTFPVRGERLRAIRHTVEPKVAYLYIPEVEQDDLPQFDGTDFISPQNRFFLSLTNRLSASMREPDGSRRRFEFLTLTVETSITPDPQKRTFSNLFLDSLQPEDITQAVEGERTPIPGRPGFSKATERDFANIVARMSITPPWPVSLDVSGSLNPETSEIETGNGRLSASYEDVASFGLGYTFSQDGKQEAWIGEFGLTVFEGARLTYVGRYDAKREVFSEHQAGLIYQTCCWALNVIYTRRDTDEEEDPDNDIRINFEILTAPSRR